jgi:lipopolysaccharide/colanic/teichoic acid biosynthesis glycosyltransferase
MTAHWYRQHGKRILDLSLATLSVILIAPIACIVALLVGLNLGGPVLFRQLRPGRGGRPFELLKFRTMRPALNGAGCPRPDAERLTTFGKFLRRTSLDELPEFWNVLRGDMSVVGPRPLLMEYLPLYSPEQARRHEVRPGITGWAQVNGRNTLSWEEKFRLDVEYVEQCSLAMDLRIFALTAAAVVSGRGVAAEGSATMPRFRGSAR